MFQLCGATLTHSHLKGPLKLLSGSIGTFDNNLEIKNNLQKI